MRSLFLKILVSSFLAVVLVGTLMAFTSRIVQRPDGPMWVGSPSFVPILAVGISGLACFLLTRHITSPLFELRKAAETLARGNLTVRMPGNLLNRRDEIGQLGRDFDRMAERLQALVEGHKRLLGEASHELRSPLARLNVAVGLARQAGTDEMPDLLDRIVLETQRLDGLIDQLLTLSRIESRSHEASASVDLTALVHEVVSDADFEARAHARRVALTSFEECEVIGSEETIRSALENVIRNGVRFTGEGTIVDVSIFGERDRTVIRVRDRGPGVPENRLPEIFLPFRRVQPTDGTRNGGSGLGLAIARNAIVVSGGDIRATNAADGGLIVDLEFPRAPGSIAHRPVR